MNKLEFLAKLSQGKILDVGFAQDANPYLKDVIGIDIQKAKKPDNYSKVLAVDLNNENMPFKGNEFDTVIAGDVIEHVYNPTFFISECNRVLKPGGHLILSTPNAHYIWEIRDNFFMRNLGDPAHLHSFTKQVIHRILEKGGFRVEKDHGTFFEIPIIKLKVNTIKFPMISNQIIYQARKVDVPTDKIFTISSDREKISIPSKIRAGR